MPLPHQAPLVRREYNQWVANETLEDYALRYTAKHARRWSSAQVANTALGIVSFLALEAIGGAITLNYGFTNAAWAIIVVGLIIFLSALPISYYSARYGLDIDLLTRGAGFGYIGSTISSLIYASFTFIFFALEAAIMSMAIHLTTGIPLYLTYIISAVAVIPLVTHGIQRISRFQAWTQPIWIALQIIPLLFIGYHEASAFQEWVKFPGIDTNEGAHFDILLFGAAASVIFPLIAQNGEQADFLRFLPKENRPSKTWWLSLLAAGPGWVIIGMIKLFVGSFLAVLALNHGMDVKIADDPTHMYTVAFGYLTESPSAALFLAGLFVVISQLKINVTNAYAGSIAWSNFFSRLTHNHPGRVVWLLFNVAIALMLMELGLYEAFEEILIIYATLVVAWIGSLIADLVINKQLGLSPKHIEFRRGYLYDINPVGTGSMLIASTIGILANLGQFGETAKAMAAFIALAAPFLTAPLIAWATKSRYYLCRESENTATNSDDQSICIVCENTFDIEDMSNCPSYDGAICSLCCSLDSRCENTCRPQAHIAAQSSQLFKHLFPKWFNENIHSVTGHFLSIFAATNLIIAGLLIVIYFAQTTKNISNIQEIGSALWKVFFLLSIVTGVLIWLYVLAQRSHRLAIKEIQEQTQLLKQEAKAHEITAQKLKQSKETADAANSAKSRYLSGVSHELRTPLNTILGYAQLMEDNSELGKKNQKIAHTIRRSSEHLTDVIEGLLEISKIEARKLDLHQDNFSLHQLMIQMHEMFQPIADKRNLIFEINYNGHVPDCVTADEKRLRQILLNLLSNAFKFTHKGAVKLDISYRNQVAKFSLCDTGVGIHKNDQISIFEPFFRAGGTSPHIPGTGLGLSITKLLVELMGGDIQLNSQPNKGSTFILSILLPRQTNAMETHTPIRFATGYQGNHRSICVVDDNSDHRELIQDYLKPLGFNVVEAQSSEECLLLINRESIDLFLLDITMPGMNGWELLHHLRKNKITVPIIMLSGDPIEYASNTGIHQTNFNDYIMKPVRLNTLIDKISQCLNLQLTYQNIIKPLSEPIQLSTDNIYVMDIIKHAKIGYFEGVSQSIKTLEKQFPTADLLERLNSLMDNYDLAGIVNLLENLKNAPRH